MKIILQRQGDCFKPMYNKDIETFHKIKDGAYVMCEVKRSRNVAHHRKFFALLNMYFENQETYKDIETLRKVLLCAIGCCEIVTGNNGAKIYIPKSINFESMGQDEFEKEVYVPCINKIAELLQCTVAEVEANKEEYY